MFRLTSYLLAVFRRFAGSVLINIVRDVLVDGTVVLGVWAQAAVTISQTLELGVFLTYSAIRLGPCLRSSFCLRFASTVLPLRCCWLPAMAVAWVG